MRKTLLVTLLGVLSLFWLAGTASAVVSNCTTSSPPLSASFSASNTGSGAGTQTETIVLTNTATCLAVDPQQVLTAVGFNYTGPTLTPASGTASTLQNTTNPASPTQVGANVDVGG